jgi:hypothetical protein
MRGSPLLKNISHGTRTIQAGRSGWGDQGNQLDRLPVSGEFQLEVRELELVQGFSPLAPAEGLQGHCCVQLSRLPWNGLKLTGFVRLDYSVKVGARGFFGKNQKSAGGSLCGQISPAL